MVHSRPNQMHFSFAKLRQQMETLLCQPAHVDPELLRDLVDSFLQSTQAYTETLCAKAPDQKDPIHTAQKALEISIRLWTEGSLKTSKMQTQINKWFNTQSYFK